MKCWMLLIWLRKLWWLPQQQPMPSWYLPNQQSLQLLTRSMLSSKRPTCLADHYSKTAPLRTLSHISLCSQISNLKTHSPCWLRNELESNIECVLSGEWDSRDWWFGYTDIGSRQRCPRCIFDVSQYSHHRHCQQDQWNPTKIHPNLLKRK